MSIRNNVTEILPAIPESLPRARRLVVDFALNHGAAPQQLDEIRLAVSEAFTNSVIHGYRGAPGEVYVTLGIAEEELWILIRDHGYGPQIPAQDPGLGWGLALIADASDEFVIAEGASGGTEVRMRFHLGDEQPCRGGRPQLRGSSRAA